MAHDHQAAEAQSAVSAARPQTRSEAPAGPLRVGRAASPASLLHLQRTAGNAAVQRAVNIGEVESTVDAAPAASTGPAGPAAAGGNQLGDGAGPVSINGSSLEVNAATTNVHSAMTAFDGVVRVPTLVADSVVASSYTPGAGNVM